MADASNTNDAIEAAARWPVSPEWAATAGPVIPALKDRFGLSALEAIDAIRTANLIRARVM